MARSILIVLLLAAGGGFVFQWARSGESALPPIEQIFYEQPALSRAQMAELESMSLDIGLSVEERLMLEAILIGESLDEQWESIEGVLKRSSSFTVRRRDLGRLFMCKAAALDDLDLFLDVARALSSQSAISSEEYSDVMSNPVAARDRWRRLDVNVGGDIRFVY